MTDVLDNTKYIKIAITDLDGVLRGKYIDKDKYISACDTGLGFCDVIFGWDVNDSLYEQDSFTGWNSAFPDAIATLDTQTTRKLPTENYKSAIVLADFSNDTARYVCPRSILKQVLQRLAEHNLQANAAAEFEFFIFNETSASIRAKNYHNLQPFTFGNFGYSILRSSEQADLYHELLNLADIMAMPIEGLHTETGPGVVEAALQYSDALTAADNAILFKTFTKVLLQKHNLMATFMAKWSGDYPGQSGHLHTSLQNLDGESVFYQTGKTHNMSDTMLHFIGGQQKLMPELLAMLAPTCNSYTRLIPGHWAPTVSSWGVDNRTCALRAILGTAKSQRVECRVTAADINPYLALAAVLGAGLWGIENKIKPTNEVTGNAYDLKFPQALQLPQSLTTAAHKLKKSSIAKELFDSKFVEHYAYTREWEAEQQRRAITDWQKNRYFEII